MILRSQHRKYIKKYCSIDVDWNHGTNLLGLLFAFRQKEGGQGHALQSETKGEHVFFFFFKEQKM